ncbi:transcriptional regulator PpsR [Primorskyibacter sp. S187A]|uniref:transcriptional regulator PpsR n=1 Tax=Primorskyibacter sp. S187A TaxID=3415130 RepID=UPI003C7C918D
MNTTGSKFWSSGAVPHIEPEELRSILSVASDIALVVSKDGIIHSVLINANDTSYGNLSHWEGRSIEEFLTSDSYHKWQRAVDAFISGYQPRPVEINHTDNANWEFPIRYTFHQVGSEDTILMLGRDLRPIAETQQQLVQAQMALERGYEARREFDSRYRMLLASTREPIVFVSTGSGRVIDLNEPAASLLGGNRDALTGVTFANEFKDKRGSEFIDSLVHLAVSDSGSEMSTTTRQSKRLVRIEPVVFRAAGDRVLLCRIEPAESQSGSTGDHLMLNLSALYQKGADAMLFTDGNGTIEAANDAFLDLADAAHLSDVRGRPLSDFLARGQVDLAVLLDNAKREGQMRMYATKLTNDFGAVTPIEAAATWLSDRSPPQVAFVIRDTGRAEAMRRSSGSIDDPAQSNVVDLVGTSSLKEIVAETTDVVEKMCIEAAVELTNNNRVAAAEMLGLSRQSLYVKLRKYGLLARDNSDG